LREYLVSEAMAALGVPTTRGLAAVTTGESVLRQEGPLRGAVLTRVAQSHIRVGTFEFFLARRDIEALRALADHVAERHYPQAMEQPTPYRALLEGVIARQAALVAHWMQLGFIHGVMNTDNCSVAGETIDYGPCAFMDRFDPDKVFSSIDRRGRYAWGNQGRVALWNLSRFAEALLVLFPDKDTAVAEAQAALSSFAPSLEAAHVAGFAAKIGIADVRQGDAALVEATLHTMAGGGVDHTLFFRRLTVAARTGDVAPVRALFEEPAAFDVWLPVWRSRIAEVGEAAADVMEKVNPIFIPRNHRVEEVIQAAAGGDYGPFERLHAVLSQPYAEQPDHAHYEAAPTPEEEVHRTFCGT
ncbi:MAG: protein adenylyltransferase SelO, partial [Planctomycetota bacterium]